MTDTVPTLYGPMVLPDWPDDLICRSLRQCGEWAAAEPELLAPLVDADEVLWDAGAYLGTFALGLARHVRPGRIVAIDANPALQPALAANLAANAPCPAQVLHTGVGAADGLIEPADDDLRNHGARAYRPAADGSGSTIACRTLAALRAEHGDYDVLKLDVEGMEEAALTGDADYLRRRRPVVWAECNEDDRSLRTRNTLARLGYDPVYVAFPAFRRSTHTGAPPIYPLAYEAALLAASPDRLARLTARIPGEEIICRPVPTGTALRQALYDTPRWGKAEWAGLGRAELIARLGRLTQGQSLADFLS